MIILGIDPGTTRIGYGIIEKNKNVLRSLEYGIIKGNTRKDKLADLKNTAKFLDEIKEKYNPDISAIESLFFFKNQKTVMSVSEMRGALMMCLANLNIPVQEYTPLQVKQAVSSYGRAGKDQVQRMVKLILGLKEDITPDDAADGLAIAICCANVIEYQQK
jgi:crossover junction endodeoxyribonuclease RuvC